MKKVVLIFSLILFAVAAFSQEITRTPNVTLGSAYMRYTGISTDLLVPTTGDTIDIVFQYTGPGYVKKVALKSRFDMRTTADTTVAVSLFGKEFADDANYVEIIPSTVSGAVTANNTILIQTSDYTETTAAFNSVAPAHDIPFVNPTAGTADTLYVPAVTIANAAQTVTPLDKSYRYYRVRYILQGNDSVGTGIKLDEVELKLYTD